MSDGNFCTNRVSAVGLNDMVKKNKYDMEMLAAKTKAAIQDKQFLDGGFTREVRRENVINNKKRNSFQLTITYTF